MQETEKTQSLKIFQRTVNGVIDEKVELSDRKAVDTVSIYHLFMQLCSRKEIALKLRRLRE